MVGVRVASELVNSWRKKVDEAVLMRKQHVKDRNKLGKNEKIPSKICSRLWRSQRDKFHFFIRMRWISIRWTPLLNIQSTCVILRRVSFSLFASLFACNFQKIKLTFSFFLKKWKILEMMETKIQSKRKKHESQYCFFI